jgi:hypothetical protein
MGWYCGILAFDSVAVCGCVTGTPSHEKIDSENQKKWKYRLTLKGHHGCVALFPLLQGAIWAQEREGCAPEIALSEHDPGQVQTPRSGLKMPRTELLIALCWLPYINTLSSCHGKNMVNAFLKMIANCQKKHGEGAYDHVLHALALLSAITPLCFLTVDLNRYQENSALHHVQHRSSLVLDAIALAFVLLTILWDLLYLTISRDSPMPSWILAAMDFLLSISVITIGDVILSHRTADGKCFPQLGECTTSARGLMQGAGGLMILTS